MAWKSSSLSEIALAEQKGAGKTDWRLFGRTNAGDERMAQDEKAESGRKMEAGK